MAAGGHLQGSPAGAGSPPGDPPPPSRASSCQRAAPSDIHGRHVPTRAHKATLPPPHPAQSAGRGGHLQGSPAGAGSPPGTQGHPPAAPSRPSHGRGRPPSGISSGCRIPTVDPAAPQTNPKARTPPSHRAIPPESWPRAATFRDLQRVQDPHSGILHLARRRCGFPAPQDADRRTVSRRRRCEPARDRSTTLKENRMSPLKQSTNIAARMGRWSARHRKTAIFGWFDLARLPRTTAMSRAW